MKSFRWDKNTIISVPDHVGAEIVVNGRVWLFDFCRRLGPLWLKKDGSERRCQNPKKAVWDAFEQWLIEHELNTK
jgi:hypothetical protein